MVVGEKLVLRLAQVDQQRVGLRLLGPSDTGDVAAGRPCEVGPAEHGEDLLAAIVRVAEQRHVLQALVRETVASGASGQH